MSRSRSGNERTRRSELAGTPVRKLVDDDTSSRQEWISTRPARCQAGRQSGCEPGEHCCQPEPASPTLLTQGHRFSPVGAGLEASGSSWWMQVDGGAWRRPQRAGMMHTIRVVHAVLESAMVCGFGASERPYPALAAYGLLRWLGGCLVTGRARDYRGGSAWFKAWLLRMQRDRHGAMPQSWWRGRAEKRRGPEDHAFRLIAHGRPGENDMLTCAGYVCNVLILVRITSQDLVLHSSACG